MPSQLNTMHDEDDNDDQGYSEEQMELFAKIGWKLLLTNKDSAFALASCALGIFNLTFFEGFLTPELLKYDLTEG